jgi:hypothetical protein
VSEAERRPEGPHDVKPWPGWIRYTLLAVLFAVVGIGLVTALYDKGFLPIAGPFVVLFLLPILLPLRRRGLRRRIARLAARLDEQLAELAATLDPVRSQAAGGTVADDGSTAQVAAQVEHARRQIAAGLETDAAHTVEQLSRPAPDSGRRDPGVARGVERAASTARSLLRVAKQDAPHR